MIVNDRENGNEKEERKGLPKGKYRMRAQGGSFGVSDNGKDYCTVRFEVVKGELVGRTITAWLYFSTPENIERSIESLRYCGCTFPGGDIWNLDGIDKNEVEVVVELEEFNGKMKSKVKWINSGGVFIPDEQRMNPEEKKNFRDRMKAAVLKTGAVRSVSGGQSRGAELSDDPPPYSDNDIPF